MATSSILGGERAALTPKGRDTDALGTGDNSDSGSDMIGVMDPGVDSDSSGTGERASVEGGRSRDSSDIAPDHLIRNGDRPGRDEIDELEVDDDLDDEMSDAQ